MTALDWLQFGDGVFVTLLLMFRYPVSVVVKLRDLSCNLVLVPWL